jgi:hypothetical protein
MFKWTGATSEWLSVSNLDRANAYIGPIFSALRDNQSDVIVLLQRTELLYLIDNRCNQGRGAQFTTLLQRFDQATFAELHSRIVERFGDPIGVEYERIS